MASQIGVPFRRHGATASISSKSMELIFGQENKKHLGGLMTSILEFQSKAAGLNLGPYASDKTQTPFSTKRR